MSEDSWLGQQTNRLSRNRYLYVENNPLNFTDPSGLAKKSVSKAAQLKAQKELAKKKAGKTHKLDGYQQNIQARQKQQAAAAKRKQQELAKKELAKKKSGKKNTLDGYQKNTIYQSQKRAQANNGYYQSMVANQKNSQAGNKGHRPEMLQNQYLRAAFVENYARSIANKKSCEEDAGWIETSMNRTGIEIRGRNAGCRLYGRRCQTAGSRDRRLSGKRKV